MRPFTAVSSGTAAPPRRGRRRRQRTGRHRPTRAQRQGPETRRRSGSRRNRPAPDPRCRWPETDRPAAGGRDHAIRRAGQHVQAAPQVVPAGCRDDPVHRLRTTRYHTPSFRLDSAIIMELAGLLRGWTCAGNPRSLLSEHEPAHARRQSSPRSARPARVIEALTQVCMPGKESGIEMGLVAFLRSRHAAHCAAPGRRPQAALLGISPLRSARHVHVRLDEQLYFSTLPMNGCALLHTSNMAPA